MARAALRWSIDELAEKACVGRATVTRFEAGAEIRPDRAAAMRSTLEAGGVCILEQDEPSATGGPGVRLR